MLWSSDQSFLAVRSGHVIEIWDALIWALLYRLDSADYGQGIAYDIGWLPQKNSLVQGGLYGLLVWDMQQDTPTAAARVENMPEAVRLAAGTDGETLFTVGLGGAIYRCLTGVIAAENLP